MNKLFNLLIRLFGCWGLSALIMYGFHISRIDSILISLGVYIFVACSVLIDESRDKENDTVVNIYEGKRLVTTPGGRTYDPTKKKYE